LPPSRSYRKKFFKICRDNRKRPLEAGRRCKKEDKKGKGMQKTGKLNDDRKTKQRYCTPVMKKKDGDEPFTRP
tara:strand:+ start:854 stop:1072 length:219 start_codon:yes stop_codon:yes gene_type:complete